jgi:hypothetical protein
LNFTSRYELTGKQKYADPHDMGKWQELPATAVHMAPQLPLTCSLIVLSLLHRKNEPMCCGSPTLGSRESTRNKARQACRKRTHPYPHPQMKPCSSLVRCRLLHLAICMCICLCNGSSICTSMRSRRLGTLSSLPHPRRRMHRNNLTRARADQSHAGGMFQTLSHSPA